MRSERKKEKKEGNKERIKQAIKDKEKYVIEHDRKKEKRT